MGLRIPQSSWLMMNPQQQFLLSNGVLPTGMPAPDASAVGGTMVPMSQPTEEQLKALEDLQAAQMQSFSNQQKGIDDLAQYAKGLQGQEVQTDLTPLAALTDAWTGSKFAQSYKAPESGTAKAAQVAALKQALNKERGALTDDEIALLKAKINALTTQSIFGQKQAGKEDEKADKKVKEDSEAGERLLKTKEADMLRGNIGFIRAIKDYEDTVNQYGEWNTLTGAPAKDIETAYSLMKAEFGKAKNLGALSGPDLEILIEAMAPQTGLSGLGTKIVGGGKGTVLKSAQALKDFSKNEFETAYSTLGKGYTGKNAESLLANFKKRLVDSEVSNPKFKTTKSAITPGTVVTGKDGKTRRFKGGENKASNWEVVETGAK